MGTHPIYESDFDCLTGMENMDPSSIYEIDDFKNKIHLLLSERNTKNKLKAHLRSEILNCSVYNYFKEKKMDVVLSVMLPSFGMKGELDVLSKSDLKSLLNWDLEDDIGLKSIVKEVRLNESTTEKRDFSAQTDGGRVIDFEEKLQMIDHAYALPISSKLDSNRLDEIQAKIE